MIPILQRILRFVLLEAIHALLIGVIVTLSGVRWALFGKPRHRRY